MKIRYLFGLLVTFSANSEVVVFENDQAGWSAMTGSSINVIDFESVASPSPQELAGDEFSALPLSPTFKLVDGGGMFVGNPGTGQTLTPTSGVNMLFPECNPACEGVIRVSFDQEIKSFGAFFIDVETDFATSGFALVANSDVPEFSFSSFQGQNAQSFLGIVADVGFSSVDIHFTTGSGFDGALIDDLSYATNDSDADGVPDSIDNCGEVANTNQIDADMDGYGNACDGDFNNDCIVNFIDIAAFGNEFLGTNLIFDLNGDGFVNFIDLSLLSGYFLSAPGPGLSSGICEE